MIGVFGEQIDLDDRLDVGEARLAWIASVGYGPVDLGRSCIGPRFDAAMPLLDNGLADDLLRRSGTEVVSDLGFEGWLVAFEGEQVIGLMFDDLVGDRDLATHGVDGHQRALELTGFGQVVEELGNSRDFIGLLGHAQLAQDQPGVARVGTQRVQRFKSLALIVCAARGLAVNGNEIMPVGPELLDPAFETLSEQNRVDAIDQALKPAHAGNAEMKLREPSQKIEMLLSPCHDVLEVVA